MIERAAITVLGSQGFIGSRLTREFIRRGDRFWAPVRQDREIFDRPLGIVYYCIGLTADYSTRPFDTVEAHVGYLAQLVERANFDYIIYLSSTRLYDDLCAPEADGDTVLKFNPNNPRHLYDLSKALGENILRTIVPERSSILRLSSVYDFEAGSPGFLSHLIQRIRDERLINLDSSATYYRDYIFIDDVVLSLIAIARYRPCGIIMSQVEKIPLIKILPTHLDRLV